MVAGAQISIAGCCLRLIERERNFFERVRRGQIYASGSQTLAVSGGVSTLDAFGRSSLARSVCRALAAHALLRVSIHLMMMVRGSRCRRCHAMGRADLGNQGIAPCR